MKSYLRLMRVHHYIKNLLVLAALACSGKLFEPDRTGPGLLAFLAFCLISSVIYIINDIQDREKDRLHPVKCGRPIASGEISVRNARILAAALFGIAMILNGIVFQPLATALLLLYLGLNLGYSFGWKNYPIVDITILVSGFLIRMVYGALITGIQISNWMYLTVMALSFYLALGKRRNELRRMGGGETREVLNAYPVSFLDRSMSMCLTLAHVFYALWSMDGTTRAAYHTDHLIFTVPIVLLITLKYSLNVERKSDGDPVEVLLHDPVLLVLTGLYLAAMILILYVF